MEHVSNVQFTRFGITSLFLKGIWQAFLANSAWCLLLLALPWRWSARARYRSRVSACHVFDTSWCVTCVTVMQCHAVSCSHAMSCNVMQATLRFQNSKDVLPTPTLQGTRRTRYSWGLSSYVFAVVYLIYWCLMQGSFRCWSCQLVS